jgi:hypothetical protein
MEKDRPLLPGIVEGALQLLDVVHYPESTLGIRVSKRVGSDGGGLGDFSLPAGSELQQRFSSFTR